MTEDTKKIFNAPWNVFSSPDDEITVIENESGRVLAELDDVETANCLARLPELYDALVEAVYDACQDCLVERSCVDGKEGYDLIENGCVYPERDCCEQCRRWIELIRKVRDGE